MTESFNQPPGGNDMPRFGGITTMFRLPARPKPAGLDVALIGVPLDIGTRKRSGSRYGPREIPDRPAAFVPHCAHPGHGIPGTIGPAVLDPRPRKAACGGS